MKAIRTIEPGDELFLRFDNHPQRVLGEFSDLLHVPNLEDYGIADEIVQQEIKVLKPHLTSVHTPGRRAPPTKLTGSGELFPNSSSSLQCPPITPAAHFLHGSSPSLHVCVRIGDALILAKKAIEVVNKRAAALLPTSMMQLERRQLLASTTPFSALRNLTVGNLELNGQCLDDVQVKQSVVCSMQKGLFAQRPIKKGNLVVPAPLYAVRHERSCSSGDGCAATGDAAYLKHCFGYRDSSLFLCPLSAASFIQTTSTRDKALPTKSNAAVKWSSRVNVKKIHKLTVDEVLEVSGLIAIDTVF